MRKLDREGYVERAVEDKEEGKVDGRMRMREGGGERKRKWEKKKERVREIEGTVIWEKRR